MPVKHNIAMSTRLIVGWTSQIASNHQQEIWDSALNTLECCPFPSSSFGHSKHRGDDAFGTEWSIFMHHQKQGPFLPPFPLSVLNLAGFLCSKKCEGLCVAAYVFAWTCTKLVNCKFRFVAIHMIILHPGPLLIDRCHSYQKGKNIHAL
jgi:hypothetical protein